MKTTPDNRRPQHFAALRRAMLDSPQATRQQLAQQTGLSAMTIGKLLGEMQARGEISQQKGESQGGGRPSMMAHYNGDYAHFAAIVVEQRGGKSAFTMSVVNLFGKTVAQEALLLDEVHADSFDGFFSRMLAAGYRLRLAVLVLPGVAEGEDMLLCDLDGLVSGQVLKRIRRLFGVEVLFENDVNAAVFGHAFEAEDAEACAGVYFPKNYCPGAGLVVRGEILHGHRHFAGELPYIQGMDRWKALDYGDVNAAAEMIGTLMVIYACTAAPRHMVLYGDFFTPELVRAIMETMNAKLHGDFEMGLSVRKTLTRDMERGAVKLGLRRMLAILDQEDENKSERE